MLIHELPDYACFEGFYSRKRGSLTKCTTALKTTYSF
jgi:hypothetical protein